MHKVDGEDEAHGAAQRKNWPHVVKQKAAGRRDVDSKPCRVEIMPEDSARSSLGGTTQNDDGTTVDERLQKEDDDPNVVELREGSVVEARFSHEDNPEGNLYTHAPQRPNDRVSTRGAVCDEIRWL